MRAFHIGELTGVAGVIGLSRRQVARCAGGSALSLSPARVELTTFGSGGQRSIRLSYGDDLTYSLLLREIGAAVKGFCVAKYACERSGAAALSRFVCIRRSEFAIMHTVGEK